MVFPVLLPQLTKVFLRCFCVKLTSEKCAKNRQTDVVHLPVIGLGLALADGLIFFYALFSTQAQGHDGLGVELVSPYLGFFKKLLHFFFRFVIGKF